jgi:hypothetical protein
MVLIMDSRILKLDNVLNNMAKKSLLGCDRGYRERGEREIDGGTFGGLSVRESEVIGAIVCQGRSCARSKLILV